MDMKLVTLSHIKPSTHNARKTFDDAAAISDSELLGFCLELLMLAQAEWNAFGEAAPALCAHYKIDIKKIKHAGTAQK
jgi:hypothetical protein